MLTTTEHLELQQFECIIEQGLQGFYEAGQALKHIRDQKLYRSKYSSFEDYCLSRWQISKPRAYQLISASQVVAELSTKVDQLPQSEAQTRPLTAIAPGQRLEAWQAAQTLAGGKPTAAQVERATQAVKAEQKQWQTGQQLMVVAKKSPFHGEIVTVIEGGDDIIIKAQMADGSFEPFLSNELSDKMTSGSVASVERSWTTQKTKPERLEALEATLQIEKLRVQMLEQMLIRLVTAARSQSLGLELLVEAEALLS